MCLMTAKWNTVFAAQEQSWSSLAACCYIHHLRYAVSHTPKIVGALRRHFIYMQYATLSVFHGENTAYIYYIHVIIVNIVFWNFYNGLFCGELSQPLPAPSFFGQAPNQIALEGILRILFRLFWATAFPSSERARSFRSAGVNWPLLTPSIISTKSYV